MAIAIEAFNKLGTVDEDQVRPMERQPSDPRPSSTDVCSIPIFSPSLVSYEPFFSFSRLAENDRRIERDFSWNFVALIWGPRRSFQTSWFSSRDLVDLFKLSGTSWLSPRDLIDLFKLRGSRLGTSSIFSNFVELRGSHLGTSSIFSNFVALISERRRSFQTSWNFVALISGPRRSFQTSWNFVELRGSHLGTSSIFSNFVDLRGSLLGTSSIAFRVKKMLSNSFIFSQSILTRKKCLKELT